MNMKLKGVIFAAVLALGVVGLVGCANSDNAATSADSGASKATSGEISIYSREDGSGTRGAFVELVGVEQKNAAGEKEDMTTSSAAITNSTSVMMTSVAGDPAGIGYISLGSMNDTVKAVKVDGAEATAENVKSGSYKVSRPFNIATKDGLSDVAQDFIKYIMSQEGQMVVEENGYISEANEGSYTPSGLSGKVTVGGSSSVTPVMEKLAEAYQKLNSGVTIEVQQSDSTTGMEKAADGTFDIGMASRELKDSEKANGLTGKAIALDGIAIIVNKDSSVDMLTSDQIKGIYTGEIADWSEVA